MIEVNNIYVILGLFLSNVFNIHQIKHEEMLQFAQSAIKGLKVSADVERLVFFSQYMTFYMLYICDLIRKSRAFMEPLFFL